MFIHLIGYKNTILTLLFINYIAKTQLGIRQLEKLLETKRPKTIKSFVNAKDFESTRVKKVEDLKVWFIKDIYNLVYSFGFLKFNVHAGIWRFSIYLVSVLIGEFKYDQFFNSLIFVIIFISILNIRDIIAHYLEFNILKESRFKDKTFTNYIFKSKVLPGLEGIIVILIGAVLAILIDRMGPSIFYYFCLLTLAINVIYSIKTTFFMNLSSKDYELLPDGELKNELESLAERIKFPLDKILITSHNLIDPKAKCTTIGFIVENPNSKNIVLYKDAIKLNSVEEVCALVSSKLAHCKLNFSLKELALDKAEVFYHYYIFTTLLYNQGFANEFGFDNIPIVVHFALYFYISIPIMFTLDFLSNFIKRKHIVEADSVSKFLGYKKSLKLGLIKLNEESSSYFNSDHWYLTYCSNGLTIVERLIALKKSKRRKIDLSFSNN
ncbi:hypothetical protein CONCODRAFT_84024 [Conidiobolus coronatus NRRL 28638]|uniref:Uncharacterized protein n=1 Tax=Conidiobolus coronatus (strain ATCC 28846 / CBS 209.66 / NRRL 28638) TaxID=796925 RepID=A0A137PBY2_CONC2|nr:hypothetical protein CONCODRAFT_84024 [Conidiobolus coronatus NRRL 28638]|eukprot:KXN72483.1 hypothetical protein CONCODRAFT_84024 [Conidiobolus coronatus NRRL 28638]